MATVGERAEGAVEKIMGKLEKPHGKESERETERPESAKSRLKEETNLGDEKLEGMQQIPVTIREPEENKEQMQGQGQEQGQAQGETEAEIVDLESRAQVGDLEGIVEKLMEAAELEMLPNPGIARAGGIPEMMIFEVETFQPGRELRKGEKKGHKHHAKKGEKEREAAGSSSSQQEQQQQLQQLQGQPQQQQQEEGEKPEEDLLKAVLSLYSSHSTTEDMDKAFDLYTTDVVFEDPLMKVIGMENVKTHFRFLHSLCSHIEAKRIHASIDSCTHTLLIEFTGIYKFKLLPSHVMFSSYLSPTITLDQVAVCKYSKGDDKCLIKSHQDIWSVKGLISHLPFFGRVYNIIRRSTGMIGSAILGRFYGDQQEIAQ